MNNFDGIESVLNEDEYTRIFPHGVGPKPVGFKREWSTMFSDIVSRVLTLEVLSTGVARSYNGALQVMTAEFQLPTPLVPSRESYYVRNARWIFEGLWVENVEVDDKGVHNLYKQLVSSGHAFRQNGGKKEYDEISGENGDKLLCWRQHLYRPRYPGNGADDVGVMTSKRVDDPGRSLGIVLSAATSS
ncbi:hypothetical protein OIU78_000985 [Salix suchowensis]|nr:hypothetical protein OIU78_000985 [Salix suchowensis]